MSSITWTRRAVASRGTQLRLAIWRAVEAQHVASTMHLVDGVGEQRLLEDILEENKPPVPAEAKTLHYLLFTPFRYPSPYGSRFRAPDDPGVFYGADERRTACAEVGYWRWRFLAESADLSQLGSIGPVPHTLFRASIESRGVDLRQRPFVRDRGLWTDRTIYTHTQALAKLARDALLGVIRYESVRDPDGGGCIAVLRPDAFRALRPTAEQTWFLTVTHEAATWQRDGEHFEFPTSLPTWVGSS